MGQIRDLRGVRFGRLLPIQHLGTKPKGSKGNTTSIWLCKCDCGNEVERTNDSLVGSIRHGYTPMCDQCRSDLHYALMEDFKCKDYVEYRMRVIIGHVKGFAERYPDRADELFRRISDIGKSFR